MTSEIRSPHQTVRLRSACGPIIETLENRTLLSVSLANGLLSITGTEAADKINVRSAPGNTIRVGLNKEVTVFDKDDVTGIFVPPRLATDSLLEAAEARIEIAVIIADVNRSVHGWLGYFQHSHRTAFPAIDRWIRMRLRSLLRKRAGLRGRGRGRDHQRWPNTFFAEHGLFTLTTAHYHARHSR